MNSALWMWSLLVPLQAPAAPVPAPAAAVAPAPAAADPAEEEDDEDVGTMSVVSFGDPPPPVDPQASTVPPALTAPPPAMMGAPAGPAPANPWDVPLYAQPAAAIIYSAPWMTGMPWINTGWGYNAGGFGAGFGPMVPVGVRAGFYLGGSVGLPGMPLGFLNVWGRTSNGWYPYAPAGVAPTYGYPGGTFTDRWNLRPATAQVPMQPAPMNPMPVAPAGIPSAGYRVTEQR